VLGLDDEMTRVGVVFRRRILVEIASRAAMDGTTVTRRTSWNIHLATRRMSSVARSILWEYLSRFGLISRRYMIPPPYLYGPEDKSRAMFTLVSRLEQLTKDRVKQR
jgi:hypothetical protein